MAMGPRTGQVKTDIVKLRRTFSRKLNASKKYHFYYAQPHLWIARSRVFKFYVRARGRRAAHAFGPAARRNSQMAPREEPAGVAPYG